MLVLNQIESALVTSEQPVIEQIYDLASKKLLVIGLRNGLALAEQWYDGQAKVMVVKGEIDLNTATHSYRLERFDTFDIPANMLHTIVGMYDAIFLLLIREQKDA